MTDEFERLMARLGVPPAEPIPTDEEFFGPGGRVPGALYPLLPEDYEGEN